MRCPQWLIQDFSEVGAEEVQRNGPKISSGQFSREVHENAKRVGREDGLGSKIFQMDTSGGSRISQKEAPTPERGANLLFGINFVKNAWKWKKNGLIGASVHGTPRSTTGDMNIFPEADPGIPSESANPKGVIINNLSLHLCFTLSNLTNCNLAAI